MRRSRAQTTRTLRLVVGRIIPSRGIGAFNLRQESSPPRNLYVALDWLQAQLKQPAQANAILIGRKAAQAAVEGQAALADALAASWRLADCGLRLRPVPEFAYLALQSGQIVLPPAAAARAERIAAEFGMSYRPSSVYLATTLERIVPKTQGPEIHYCLVAGLDPRAAPAGPLPMAGGGAPPALGKNDILLNAWAAQALGARVGDSIGPWKAQVRGIVAMEGAALDQGLVPEFEGITDAASIADWDLPFAIDAKLITPADEAYWRQYRTVPKAFLPLDVVRGFWPATQQSGTASSYGGLTSVALAPPEGMSLKAAAERFESAFRRGPASDFGLAVQPVRAQALATAKGTTDFGVIFLSMSFFLVAAAAGMVGLLLRLAVERRASQFGIMSATGFPARSAARVLTGEGFLLGAAGVLLGVPGGHRLCMADHPRAADPMVGRGRGFESRPARHAAEPGDRRGRGIPRLRGRRHLGRAAAAPHADAATARRLARDGRAAAEAHPPARARNRHRRPGPGGGIARVRTAGGAVRPKARSWAAAHACSPGSWRWLARDSSGPSARRPRKFRSGGWAGAARRATGSGACSPPASSRPRASSSSWWRRTKKTCPARTPRNSAPARADFRFSRGAMFRS